MKSVSFITIFALPLALFATHAGAVNLTVPLFQEFDSFGSQIEMVQIFSLPGEDDQFASSIYDTGASVITFSAADQSFFSPKIPIKVFGGAEASAIGGTLEGDVSEPVTITAAGIGALSISSTFEITVDTNSGAATVPGIQAFVGTSGGSSNLPTITGTPIHRPSAQFPSGAAAHIDMNGYLLDLGDLFGDLLPEFQGITFAFPDIAMVASGGTLASSIDPLVHAPVRIPLTQFGSDNTAGPGDMISFSTNPVQEQVLLENGAVSVTDKTFLFDTGAQLSIISSEIAVNEFGLDLSAPPLSIAVQGAAGTVESIPGFVIDALELPIDDDGNGTPDGTLRFENVPVFVLDFATGLDGILGMNLFNTADELLYDPFDVDGSLRVTFNQGERLEDTEEAENILFLQELEDQELVDLEDELEKAIAQAVLSTFPSLTSLHALPGVGLDASAPAAFSAAIPEPATFLPVALGLLGLARQRRRRGRRFARQVSK